jgi:hypothetical protein
MIRQVKAIAITPRTPRSAPMVKQRFAAVVACDRMLLRAWGSRPETLMQIARATREGAEKPGIPLLRALPESAAMVVE